MCVSRGEFRAVLERGDQDGQSGEGAGSSRSLRGIRGWRGTGVTCAVALLHTTDRSVPLFHPQLLALLCSLPVAHPWAGTWRSRRDMEEQEGQVLCVSEARGA